jgi:hypothetical protein
VKSWRCTSSSPNPCNIVLPFLALNQDVTEGLKGLIWHFMFEMYQNSTVCVLINCDKKICCLHSDVERQAQTLSDGHMDRRQHVETQCVHISRHAYAYVTQRDITHVCVWHECLLVEHDIIVCNRDAIVPAVSFRLFTCFVQQNRLQHTQWEWQITTAICTWHHLERTSEKKASDITYIFIVFLCLYMGVIVKLVTTS